MSAYFNKVESANEKLRKQRHGILSSKSRNPNVVKLPPVIIRTKPPRCTCVKALTENRPTLYHSTYEDFNVHDITRTEPIRSGSSSGERRNNPHPPESFMVWCHPSRRAPQLQPLSEVPHLCTRLVRDSVQSTYREDYQEHQNLANMSEQKASRPESNTCSNHLPKLSSKLQVPTTRYGSNTGILKASMGALPSLVNDMTNIGPMRSRNSTQYSTDFSTKPDGVKLPKLQDHSTTLVAMTDPPSVTRPMTSHKRSKHGKCRVNQGARQTQKTTGVSFISDWPGPDVN